MESAEPESSQPAVPTANELVIEWSATIRGASVSVRWRGGRLEGDREVLDRISHLGAGKTRVDSIDGARHIVNQVLLDPVEILHLPATSAPISPGPSTPNEPLPPPPDLAS